MELKKPGSQPSAKGPAQWFTGSVRVDMLNAPPAPARHSAPVSLSSPVRAATGTRIHWARR
jgi:hypothetical protein